MISDTLRQRTSKVFRLFLLFALALLVSIWPYGRAFAAVTTAAAVSHVAAPTSVKNTPGDASVSYTASFVGVPPVLKPGEVIATQSWHWTDNCVPQDGSKDVTINFSAAQPGPYSSTAGCSVLWSIGDGTGKIVRIVKEHVEATTALNFGGVWSPGAVSGGVLTAPQNQSAIPATPVVLVASPGESLQCSVSDVTATDVYTFNGKSTNSPANVSYSWACSNGSFDPAKRNVNKSTSPTPTWYAPSGDVISSGLSSTISAVLVVSGPIGPYDGGTRSHVPITEAVTAYVPQIAVSGGAFAPANVYVGQTVSAKVSAKVTPTIPDVSDNVSWASNVLWFSRSGVVGTFHPYFGNNAFTNSSTSLSGSFQGHYLDPGYYILEVTATDALKDKAGNVLCTLSGCGLINGSWSFIEGKAPESDSDATPAAGVNAWYGQAWTSQNKPYIDAREAILDEAVKSSFDKVAEEYVDKEKATSAPTALDVYKATYALWLEANSPTSSESHVSSDKILTDVEHNPGSRAATDYHSSEFVRMRFLYESLYDPHKTTIAAGKRLLAAFPNDPDIIAGQIHLLSNGADPAETKAALALCSHLIQIQPNAAATYKAVGSAFYIAYAWDNDPNDRATAIDYLRKFIDLAPSDDPFVAFAKDRIAQLSTEI